MARDPSNLIEIFLDEADEIVAALEHGGARLTDGAEPTGAAVGSLAVLAHRLTGAAGLHGFRQLANLASTLEAILNGALDGRPVAGPAVKLLEQLTSSIRRVVETIRSTGQEAVDRSASAATAPDTEGRDSFIPEALDYLATLSGCLLALEHAPGDAEQVATFLRVAHTLKGAAYVVGWPAIGDLAHRMEDVLVGVRARPRMPIEPMIGAVRNALTAIHGVLVGIDRTAADADRTLEEAAARLRPLAGAESATGPDASRLDPGPVSPGPVRDGPAASGRRPRSARRRGDQRAERLLALVGELVRARTQLEHDVRQLERLEEYLSAGQARLAGALHDFERSRVLTAPSPSVRPWRGKLPIDDRGRRATEPLGSDARTPHVHDSMALECYDDYGLLGRRADEIGADLAVVRAQLAAVRRLLGQDAARVQRLATTLRGELLRARLVPVRKLFSRAAHQVRQLAAAAGKTVAVTLRGDAVEVDEIVIERMADPILHVIRNAIAHGIEDPDDRHARAKPREGTVSLTAYHRGGYVVIEVQDDGRGVDCERLKAEAVRLGLLPREIAPLLEGPEAVGLIFLPGLSTAPTATAAAGRGIGLDAVRTEVAALNGEISVESEPGIGTRFIFRIPVMRAASDALFVRVGATDLAIPLTAIRRVLRVRPEDVVSAGFRETIRVDGHVIEFIRLDRVLRLPAPDPTGPVPVLVLGGGGNPLAVAVDDLVGKDEIVIEEFGELLDGAGPFAGATVSADGRVILVLDPLQLRERGQASVAAAGLKESESAADAADPGTILLVDDSISVRKFVGQMLTRSGFAVETASDGVEALAMVETMRVRLLITDLEMPRLNGFELIHELRRRSATRELPIVVLTTRAGAEHLNLARWLGVSRYMSKPVDEHEFVSCIAGLTGAPQPV
jgi:chemosensory pili system protein ChpA (sensor histidine kinase/response regulator)